MLGTDLFFIDTMAAQPVQLEVVVGERVVELSHGLRGKKGREDRKRGSHALNRPYKYSLHARKHQNRKKEHVAKKSLHERSATTYRSNEMNGT